MNINCIEYGQLEKNAQSMNWFINFYQSGMDLGQEGH
jgi:hypothetical protein